MNSGTMGKMFSGLLILILIIGRLQATENKPTDNKKKSKAVCVLEYRMEDGSDEKLLDSSGFGNHAKVIGLPYEKIFKRIPRKNGGKALKIGDDPLGKQHRRGAFIPASASLRPEEFIIDFEIKPEKAHEKSYADIFVAQTSPFYYNKKKTKQTKCFYPLKIWLLKNNRLLVSLSLLDDKGKIKSRHMTTKTSLPVARFISVRLVCGNGELKVFFDQKLVGSWNLNGKVIFDHPDYFPGHVAYKFGSGFFSGELDNFRIYDLKMADKFQKHGIKISTDHHLNFFAAEEPKEFTVGTANFTDITKKGTLTWLAVDHNDEIIGEGEKKVTLDPRKESVFKIEIPSEQRGCFWLKCVYTGNDGQKTEREEQFAVGAIRDLGESQTISHFGIDTWEPGYLRLRLPDIGMKWARLWLSWRDIEPKQGEWSWEVADAALAYHQREGRKVMACLSWTPSWAVSDAVKKRVEKGELRKISTRSYPAADPKQRKEFLEKIVSRYRDKVDVWEVWNEANCGAWRGTPEGFIAMLKQTHEIIRRLDPTAKIAGPSSCYGGWDAWNDEILELGAGDYMDIFAVHYLGGGYPGIDPEKAPHDIKGTRDMLKNRGVDLPIWDGESGYFCATRDAETNRPYTPEKLKEKQANKECLLAACDPEGSPHCVDEVAASAAYVRKVALCLSKNVKMHVRHRVGLMTYEADLGNRGFYVSSKGTGVLLPAIAWATMVEQFGNAEFIRKLDLGDNKLYGLIFKNQRTGRHFGVFWSSEGQRDINLIDFRQEGSSLMKITSLGLAGGSPKLRKYDIWGNPAELAPLQNGQLPLELSVTPFYLDGISEKTAMAEPVLEITAPAFVIMGKAAKIKLTVKNPFDADMAGKIVMNAPEDVKVVPKESPFKLSPGKESTQEVELMVSPSFQGRVFQTTFTLKSSNDYQMRRSIVFRVAKPPLAFSRKTGKIVIDGKTDDPGWRGDGTMILDDETQLVQGSPKCYADPATHAPDKEWVGPRDLSAKAEVRIDQGNLYLLIKVKDDSLTIIDRFKRPFRSDGVEIFIDGRPPKDQTDAKYTKGVCHLILTPGDAKSPKATWLGIGETSTARMPWDIQVASEKVADGYVIEAKIPLDKRHFPKLDLKNGGVIGFDLCVNDADRQKPRKSQISWRGAKDNYKNAAKFGKLAIPSQTNKARNKK